MLNIKPKYLWHDFFGNCSHLDEDLSKLVSELKYVE